jgi:hypothetical protein
MAPENSEKQAGEEQVTAEKQSKKKKPSKKRVAAPKSTGRSSSDVTASETGTNTQKQKRSKAASKKGAGTAAKGTRTVAKKSTRKTEAKNMTSPEPDELSKPSSGEEPVEEARDRPDVGDAAVAQQTESAVAPEPEKPARKTPTETLEPDPTEKDRPRKVAKETPVSGTSMSTVPPDDTAVSAKQSEPLPGFVKWLIGGFIVLIALIVITSYQNMQKYFVVAQHGAVEIWKGKFSPMGRKLVVIMPGVLPPAEKKAVYNREDVFPLIFQYYIYKADTLMEVPGAPDFIDIKNYLDRAMDYAITDEMQSVVKANLDNIDRTVLLYKADVAAAKGTIEDLKSAREYLDQAAALNPDEPEANLIQQKIEAVGKQIEALESARTEPPSETTTPETPEVSSEPPPQEKAPESREQTF